MKKGTENFLCVSNKAFSSALSRVKKQIQKDEVKSMLMMSYKMTYK